MNSSQQQSKIFKFSHRKIEQLAAPEPEAKSGNIEYTDAVESGLRIAVYKSGRRSFRHRYTFLGVKKMMTLGEFPAVNLDKARERVRANKAMLAEDIDPKEERQQQRDASTFAEFTEDHYLPFAKKERRSFTDIANRIEKRLNPVFGDRQMPRISKQDISRFHLQLRDDVSATTANRYLALASSVFTRAIELGVVTVNPCRGISKFKEGGGRKRVLSKEELDRFTASLRQEMETGPGQAIFLMMATGLRKGEILSLQWSNIDLENCKVYLPNTKSGVPRYAPLNSQAIGFLQQMQLSCDKSIDWVFPSKSKKGHLLDTRRTFKTIIDRAGIEALRMHDLRRSFASILINSGVPIYEIRDLLGHADIRTTQIYAHLGTSTLQTASEAAAVAIKQAFDATAQ